MAIHRVITLTVGYSVMCVTAGTIGTFVVGQIVGGKTQAAASSMIGCYCKGIDGICRVTTSVAKGVSDALTKPARFD